MPLRRLFLIAGVALAPGFARAESFDLLSATRVAEIAARDVAAFKGGRRPVRAPLLVPPDGLGCADSFRRDELPIWSATSGTTWHLLPPKLLGTAAAPTEVVEAR